LEDGGTKSRSPNVAPCEVGTKARRHGVTKPEHRVRRGRHEGTESRSPNVARRGVEGRCRGVTKPEYRATRGRTMVARGHEAQTSLDARLSLSPSARRHVMHRAPHEVRASRATTPTLRDAKSRGPNIARREVQPERRATRGRTRRRGVTKSERRATRDRRTASRSHEARTSRGARSARRRAVTKPERRAERGAAGGAESGCPNVVPSEVEGRRDEVMKLDRRAARRSASRPRALGARADSRSPNVARPGVR